MFLFTLRFLFTLDNPGTIEDWDKGALQLFPQWLCIPAIKHMLSGGFHKIYFIFMA
jgi:hypothetical protein